MMYSVGDIVRIRPDLKTGKRYAMRGQLKGTHKICDAGVNPSMVDLRGRFFSIYRIDYESNGRYYYRIADDDGVMDRWYWTDDMFESDSPCEASSTIVVNDDLSILFG